MTVTKFVELQMVQNDIPNKMELSRVTGIDYQRLNRRIKAPSTMTLSELGSLSLALNLDENGMLEFLKETGTLWCKTKTKKK